jgi:DNA-binding transcriptional MerR regulator
MSLFCDVKTGETMTTMKFPKCEEYGIELWAMADKRYVGVELKQVEQALTQAENKGNPTMEANLAMAESRVEEKEERITTLEGNLKAYEGICRQYKAQMKENKVYSCGNCLKLEAQLKTAREQSISKDCGFFCAICKKDSKYPKFICEKCFKVSK